MSRAAQLLQRLQFRKKDIITGGISQQLATGEDIDALLDRSWIRRLWTYQEIILANNPIVVCGNKHIPWSVFEKSVLFLEHTCLFDARDLTKPWVNAAIARSQLQISSAASVTETSELERYVQFVYTSSQAAFKLLIWKQMGTPFWFFAMASLCLIVVTSRRSRSSKALLGMTIVAAAGMLACGFWAGISGLKSHRRSFEMKCTFLTEEALLTGLYSRKAKEPKDMAYGMWAVLKQGGTKGLPEPDYSLSTGDVFKTFTVHIMQMTQSIEPLLLSALKGMAGQPSWVPDWTARAVLVRKTPPQQSGKLSTSAFFPSYSAQEVAMRKRTRRQFRFSKDMTVLEVWGTEICHITLTARFKKTRREYFDGEKNAHLHNLHLILDYNLLDLVGEYAEYSGATMREVNTWVSFCREHSGESLDCLLQSLRKRPEIFRTHVLICKNFIRERWAAFRACPGEYGYSCSGFCSYNAQGGDHVVCFEGIPDALVVRPLNISTTSIKVVGLVNSWTEKAKDKDFTHRWLRYQIR